MQRPIGVTLLAVGAALAGIFELWRMLVFLGIAKFTFVGKDVSFDSAQWGPALWALIIALIWFWVAAGFWNLRAYAWSFGNFIAIFTVIFGFFALLGGSTMEAETVGWLLAIAIFFYLNYPGVQQQFMDHELSLLTPEQRAAVERAQAANVEAARAMSTPSSTPPPPPPPAAPGDTT
jgi:hypothetical protein